MSHNDKNIGFLALRAIVVTGLVLLILWSFDQMNITAIGQDVPPTAVEHSIAEP